MTHMDLVRWEPFLRDTIAGRFHQLFDSSRRAPVGAGLPQWTPAVDIFDDGAALVLEAELPGCNKDSMDIRVENQVLVISGERRPASKGDRSYLRSERNAGVFTRSFALPTSIDHSKLEATYRDGILWVRMPKTESALPRRIDVKVH